MVETSATSVCMTLSWSSALNVSEHGRLLSTALSSIGLSTASSLVCADMAALHIRALSASLWRMHSCGYCGSTAKLHTHARTHIRTHTIDWSTISYCKEGARHGKVGQGATVNKTKGVAAHLHLLGLSACRCYKPQSRWRIASVTPDLWLPSKLLSITALPLVANYTAWWQRQVCVSGVSKAVLDSAMEAMGTSWYEDQYSNLKETD